MCTSLKQNKSMLSTFYDTVQTHVTQNFFKRCLSEIGHGKKLSVKICRRGHVMRLANIFYSCFCENILPGSGKHVYVK